MRLEKLYPVFIFLFLVNFGQIAAQSPEAPETPSEPAVPKAPAAEKQINRLGFGLGYSFAGYREETDLPLNRYIDALNFNMNGNTEFDTLYYSFNFGILFGKTKPLEIKNNDNHYTYYQRDTIFMKLYFENAFDYRLWGKNIFPGYIGCSLRDDLYFSALEDSSYAGLTMMNSINLHITQRCIISGKNEFILSVSIPVFGYGVRPPPYGIYYSADDGEESITSLHNYRAVFGDLKYFHKLETIERSLSFYFGLGFELSHITFPQPRKDASFCINAGIAFSF